MNQQLSDTTLLDTPVPLAPSGAAWRRKRALDWGLALVLTLLLAPILLALALAVKLDSKGPVFFRQPRFGLGAVPFRIYKFRTMYTDLGDITGGQQTGHNDPRVTRVGGFLRKYSLDELPQVLNVLLGQMALVGPRAHPCGMKVDGVLCEALDPRYHHRHAVPPGITGWAQVNGSRGPVDSAAQLHRRVDLDLDYIANWSLPRETEIYQRTARVVIGAKGAR
ncbi:MAG: sugar transferase [Pelagimonas sp.]|jgi:lipopolysaccharide/colanic/teichoic acid biosynthesis glycosyltransferase|nr:sugar transferase [Pelagimonas sp.]